MEVSIATSVASGNSIEDGISDYCLPMTPFIANENEQGLGISRRSVCMSICCSFFLHNLLSEGRHSILQIRDEILRRLNTYTHSNKIFWKFSCRLHIIRDGCM